MKQRIYALDNLKGFLILLVVLGHCIQFTTDGFDHVVLFRFIYSFHMPLFMWVSGYVNYREHKIEIGVLRRRAIQLALPFLAWTLLNALIAQNPFYIIDAFFDPAVSVWFVWDLFLIICFSTIINFFSTKYGKSEIRCTIVAFLIVAAIIKGFHIEVLDLYHALYMGIYYIMGYYMHKHQVISKFSNAKLWGGILMLFIMMSLFWQRELPPVFIPNAPKIVGTLWNIITAVLACSSIPFLLFGLMDRKIKVLTYLGRQTLGIYVIHQSFLRFLISQIDGYDLPYWSLVLLLAVITIVVSQFINILLQCNKVTALVMLGKM